eukprot:TRINITY_DN2687_c0_g1_i1.p1 TRINITY_DN2687_c0_g1~~TRINITY_DN2687_c0_g1_i1.p1  ORF type:complete len:180 (+),score=34.77 TRINITY_DN2687_c0_g1_i1:25-540(+)
MNGLFSELKNFNTSQLKDVETVVKVHKPLVSLDQITDESKKDAKIETYEGESIGPLNPTEAVRLSPMEEFLIALGVEGSVDDYSLLLEDSGYLTSDDFLLNEPSLEELERIGIVIEEDRMKIYRWYKPEEKIPDPEAAVPDEIISIMSGIDPEIQEIMRLKKEVETLSQLK